MTRRAKIIGSATLALVIVASVSAAALGAPRAPAGYDPATDDIELPPEEELFRIQREDMLAMDAMQGVQGGVGQDPAALERQLKELQESAEETKAIQIWEKMDSEIKLRRYDEMVFDMRKDFDEAKRAASPFLGEQGYVIYPYGEVIPIVTCRPMRMTDIALEPGESITGIHAGDTVRWMFAPSQSMKAGQPVSHIVVKPVQPGISTSLLVHTDRRTYNIDLTATEGDQYIRGAAFSYPMSDLTPLFTANRPQGRTLEDELQAGIKGVDVEGLYTRYSIKARGKPDWTPDAVFDDGEKTYLRMPSRFSEAPALYVRLDKKDTLVNYRIKGRYYIVDRLFDRAYLKIGDKRVTIIRTEKLATTNVRESREAERERLRSVPRKGTRL